MKNFKKVSAAFLAATMSLGMIPMIPYAVRADEPCIDDYFVDGSQLKYYAQQIVDTNGDNYLSPEEIEDITEIEFFRLDSGLDIDWQNNTLDGIELFWNLDMLNCELELVDGERVNPGVTGTLDLTYMPNIQNVYLRNNSLNELILPEGFNRITNIDVAGNFLMELDVMGCSNLGTLDCSDNNINELVLGIHRYMTLLDCSNNCLGSLDVTGCPQLSILDCSENTAMFDIYLSDGIEMLDCHGMEISYLNVSMCYDLAWLDISNTFVSDIDLSGNPKLRVLYADTLTSIDTLDISNNPYLINAYENGSQSADTYGNVYTYLYTYADSNYEDCLRIGYTTGVVNNPESVYDPFEIRPGFDISMDIFSDLIFYVYVQDVIDTNHDGILTQEEADAVTSIKIIPRYEGQEFPEGYDQFISDILDNYPECTEWTVLENLYNLRGIQCFTNLEYLEVTSTGLARIDLSRNTKITEAYLNDNELKQLVINNLEDLEILNLAYNPVQGLDVSGNPNLVDLYLANTGLMHLDASNLNNLQTLSIENSACWELILPESNEVLTTIDAQYCQLYSIDVSNCPNLTYFDISFNPLSELDVSNNPELILLNVEKTEISELNIDNNPNLFGLTCIDTNVDRISISNNPHLIDAYLLGEYEEKDFDDYCYVYEDGSEATLMVDVPVLIDNWVKLAGEWYLFVDGEMVKGWYQDTNGNWYYLNPDDGSMVKGWKMISGSWFYFKDSGVMATGWKSIDGKWYFLNDNGAMYTGWKQQDGDWYYFDASGVMATGWTSIDGKYYYFDTSWGIMQTGWLNDNGTWYYLKSSGAMATGWLKVGRSWYYFKSSGAMATGWQKISGKWFYFDASGAMKSGWVKVNGEWYYIDENAGMKTGWLKDGDKWYFLQNSGVMARNTTINGYRINASGVWVS